LRDQNPPMRASYLVLFFLFASFYAGAQSFVIPDSLVNMAYEDLESKFYIELRKNTVDTAMRLQYAKTYFKKAQKDKKLLEITIGYGLIGYSYFGTEKYEHKGLVYLDSAIAVAKRIRHERYPMIFFINKGVQYESKGRFREALDQFLEAIKCSKKMKNELLTSVVMLNIGSLKRDMGKYEEAKVMFRNVMSRSITRKLITKGDTLRYLAGLSGRISIHIRTKQIDSALVLNDKGFEKIKGSKVRKVFELNKAILQFYDKKYENVIRDVDKALLDLLSPGYRYFLRKPDLIMAYLYQGRSYEALNNENAALRYYRKIDSIANSSNYILPETRWVYKRLMLHYKSKGDTNKQLFYIDKLLRSDSILDSNYQYVSDKLIKEYDTPNLLKEKEALIASLTSDKKTSADQVIWISLALVLSLGVVGFYYYRQRLYKQRFLKVVADQQQEVVHEAPKATAQGLGISKDTVDGLIAHLQNFEDTQGYLKAKINAKDLAKSFGSNSTYLSQVVNTYKGKNLSTYINDLRIAYVVKKLQSDSKFRKYTIKAIAQEVGFNTAEAFAKAFHKNTGIYPSYFIKKLDK